MSQQQYNSVIVEQNNHSTTIFLNRPEKHNAFNAEMIAELTAAVKFASSNEENRFMLIRGNGKSFSAGADLNYMKSMAQFSEQENKDDSKQLFDLFQAIYDSPIPTICYVHGASFGGSNGLIAACDYAIAHESTKYSFSEVKLGLLPATISPFVIEKIGNQSALDLFLTGRRFTSQEAKETRLINQIVTDETAEESITAYCRHFKSAAPQAVKACKELIRNLQTATDKRDYTADLIAKARVSTEGQEGITAFFEKRKPNWNN